MYVVEGRVLSSECVTLPCDVAWAALYKDALADSMCPRDHVNYLVIEESWLAGGNWHMTELGTNEEKTLLKKHSRLDSTDLRS